MVDHAQICILSGFIYMRHNDTTDFPASRMKEIYKDVEIEPKLQQLTGESFLSSITNADPNARADIRVRGFWTRGCKACFDTRVFYPHEQSFRSRPVMSIFRTMESDKKKKCGDRIREVDHGSFIPLAFFSCGSMGHEASVELRKLADALATKRKENYSHVIGWL